MRSGGPAVLGAREVVEEGRQLVEEVLGVHRPIVCTYDPIVSAEHDLERVVELRRSSLERAGYDREAAHTLAETWRSPSRRLWL